MISGLSERSSWFFCSFPSSLLILLDELFNRSSITSFFSLSSWLLLFSFEPPPGGLGGCPSPGPPNPPPSTFRFLFLYFFSNSSKASSMRFLLNVSKALSIELLYLRCSAATHAVESFCCCKSFWISLFFK